MGKHRIRRPSPEGKLSIAEAAEYTHVCRQAVAVAIYKGQIKAEKICQRWYTTKEDIDAYRANKYNRDEQMRDGEKLFDPEKGRFSVGQVAKVMSAELGRAYPTHRVYYLLRTGQLKALRKGSSWIIAKEDAIELLQRERGEEARQLGFA